jgi:hypothetical protein
MDFVVTVRQAANGLIMLRRIIVGGVRAQNAVAKAKELGSLRYGRAGFDWGNAEHEPK